MTGTPPLRISAASLAIPRLPASVSSCDAFSQSGSRRSAAAERVGEAFASGNDGPSSVFVERSPASAAPAPYEAGGRCRPCGRRLPTSAWRRRPTALRSRPSSDGGFRAARRASSPIRPRPSPGPTSSPRSPTAPRFSRCRSFPAAPAGSTLRDRLIRLRACCVRSRLTFANSASSDAVNSAVSSARFASTASVVSRAISCSMRAEISGRRRSAAMNSATSAGLDVRSSPRRRDLRISWAIFGSGSPPPESRPASLSACARSVAATAAVAFCSSSSAASALRTICSTYWASLIQFTTPVSAADVPFHQGNRTAGSRDDENLRRIEMKDRQPAHVLRGGAAPSILRTDHRDDDHLVAADPEGLLADEPVLQPCFDEPPPRRARAHTGR